MSTMTDPSKLDLAQANKELAAVSAAQAVRWAYQQFGDGLVMTSSFGTQAAVMLHLVTQEVPRIPVIFIDTGFHFPETYRFADDLTERLNLNLKIYNPVTSAAWMVARHGELWKQGETDDERISNLNKYDAIRKVEPLNRAMKELNVTAWLAGLRGGQTNHRAGLQKVATQNKRIKVHPILDWTTKDVHQYLKAHDLPYHPLYEEGYASIGDWHSTFKIGEGQDERSGRFQGLKQECGIHLPQSDEESASRDSSGL